MPFDFEKVRRLRDAAGLTMQDAATAAGMNSRQVWNSYETGARTNITLDVLERIANALKVDARDLIATR